jgi:hypothetical protein
MYLRRGFEGGCYTKGVNYGIKTGYTKHMDFVQKYLPNTGCFARDPPETERYTNRCSTSARSFSRDRGDGKLKDLTMYTTTPAWRRLLR